MKTTYGSASYFSPSTISSSAPLLDEDEDEVDLDEEDDDVKDDESEDEDEDEVDLDEEDDDVKDDESEDEDEDEVDLDEEDDDVKDDESEDDDPGGDDASLFALIPHSSSSAALASALRSSTVTTKFPSASAYEYDWVNICIYILSL
jgi:hypothetical protein